MLVDYIINPSWTECPNCGNISSSPNAYRTICPVCHSLYSTTANYLKLEADKTFIDDSKEELVEIVGKKYLMKKDFSAPHYSEKLERKCFDVELDIQKLSEARFRSLVSKVEAEKKRRNIP